MIEIKIKIEYAFFIWAFEKLIKYLIELNVGKKHLLFEANLLNLNDRKDCKSNIEEGDNKKIRKILWGKISRVINRIQLSLILVEELQKKE